MEGPTALLYDADLRPTASLGAAEQPKQVGDRVRYAGRGEYVVFRVEQTAEGVVYHAVASGG